MGAGLLEEAELLSSELKPRGGVSTKYEQFQQCADEIWANNFPKSRQSKKLEKEKKALNFGQLEFRFSIMQLDLAVVLFSADPAFSHGIKCVYQLRHSKRYKMCALNCITFFHFSFTTSC